MLRSMLPTLVLASIALPSLAEPPDSTGTLLPWTKPTTWDIEIARPDEPGPRFEISGRVIGLDSLPAAGVKLYAYHADTKGRYVRRRGEFNRIAGVLRTNAQGESRIRSILPGMYAGPGHVHFEVWNNDRPERSTWVALYATPDTPPVPTWEHTRTASHEWSATVGLLTVDSSGIYHCRKDLWMANMMAVPASYDSLMRGLKNQTPQQRRQSLLGH